MNGNTLVVYVPGSLHLKSILTPEGRCEYSGETPRPEEVMTLDEAIKLIHEVHNDRFVNQPWTEISYERWNQMFEMLPPQNYRRIGSFHIFRMQEYIISNIADHFVMETETERCWFKPCRHNVDYGQIVEQIKELMEES